MQQDTLVEWIVQRLEREEEMLRERFSASKIGVGVRYCVIDDLLPTEIAQEISARFPAPDTMRLMSSFRERKYTSKNFDMFDPLMKKITFALQDERVVNVVGRIVGISQQQPDPALYAGGLSAMCKGHFLGPHIDNSHEASRSLYRTLNLLYYVSPDWKTENGGHLELWDKQVRRRVIVESKFNRLALMETTPTSWHSVSKIESNGVRRCVSNYYFSPISPTGKSYYNVTTFSARPEQPIRRMISRIDSWTRQLVRKLAPDGLGKKDVYKGNKD